MTKRKDGKKTRLNLLNTACEVFAQKGYRDAKVSEICKRAGVNLASINYYFGDKKHLYCEAWQHASEKMEEQDFSDSATASALDRLRLYIQTLIKNFSVEEGAALFNRLYLMELVNPTGLIQDAWHEMIEPRRQKLHDIIREILGPAVEDLDIRFCEMSIVNQCRIFVTIKRSDLEYLLGRPLSPELIRRLSKHIADFSLAGIKAVGNYES
ncbi:TetR family transcriptional regulator [Desulfosarcina widdelii]|uniref:TetR family transcriptional regulator n=1 Tax=Desulfosarcina widdelii TaxID=947919 RepID=A0A5K7YXD1_9BACT|nr:CerR family C-terminal domain-containing protein [Desulfosarcina widdelii]BBO73055.1 TetR family transcriptional regulator [Desulfosarcina widdelii]